MMPVPSPRYAHALWAGLATLGIAGCTPAPVTVQGADVKTLYDIFLVAAAGVFLLVAGLIGWSIIRYRAPLDAELPRQTESNLRLELVWWALPTLLVIILFVLTAGVLNRVDAAAPEDEALVVRVTGFQWQWQFDYEESGARVIGLQNEPAEAVLPVGRPITFLLTSPDVQHAFFVPRFLLKRDLYPDRENRIDLEIAEEGVYTGHCAEFCGLLHAEMLFSIRAVSAEEFESWLAEQAGDGS